MAELLGILCGAMVVLSILAVVGHGIWVALAALFRLIFGSSAKQQPKPTVGPYQRELDEIERRLRALHARGDLSPTTHRDFQKLLDEARIPHVLSPPPAKEAATEPLDAVILAEAIELPTATPPTVESEPPLAPVVARQQPPAAVHPLDRIEPAEQTAAIEPSKPREPARPLSMLLRAFMEEKNIRWGEITAGMLIVGSGVGLVVSLWKELQNTIPYFPALLFMLVTAAIYGAGMYTLRRWKLASTSRGLLVIAMLLIPLNFMGGIALSPEDRTITDPLYLLAVTVGIVGFGTIAVSASRALMRSNGWLMAIAVMGTSVSQLIIHRMATDGMSAGTLIALGLLPAVAYLVPLAVQLQQASRWRRLTAPRTGQIFLLLGIASFAVLMPYWLLVWQSGEWRDTLSQLTLCLSLSFAGPLSLGLLIHRRATTSQLIASRTAGTAITVFSAAAMVATLVLAWPEPNRLIGVGLANFVALTYIAISTRFHYLHVAATLSAALASLTGFHLIFSAAPAEASDWGPHLAALFLYGRSGVVLGGLAVLLATVAAVLRYRGRLGAALGYLAGSGIIAAASTVIAIYAGFWTQKDVEWTTPLMAIVAVGALAAAIQLRHAAVAWVGSALLLIAAIHALTFNGPLIERLVAAGLMPTSPFLAALVAHAALCTLIAIVAKRSVRDADIFLESITTSAMVTSIAATPLILWTTLATAGAHAGFAAVVAVVWLSLCVLCRWPALFAGFQAMATVALCFATTAVCVGQNWWSGTIFHPHHIQALLGVLVVWCGLWTVARITLRRVRPASSLLQLGPFAIDRGILQVTVFGVAALAVLGCMPGVTREFNIDGTRSPLLLISQLSYAELGVLCALLVATVMALSCHALGSHRQLGLRPLVVTLVAFVLLAVSQLGPVVEQIWQWIGVDHALAYAWPSWVLWLLCSVVLVVSLWDRFATSTLANLVYLGPIVPFLIAAQQDYLFASASTLRWGLAIYGVLVAVAICGRRQIAELAGRIGMPGWDKQDSQVTESLRTVGLLQVALPVLLLTTGIVVATATGQTLGGPAEASIFAASSAVSYAGPIIVLALALVAYAIRERVAMFALAASLLVNLAVSVGYMIPHWIGDASTTGPVLASLLQINTMTSAVCGMVWLAVSWYLQRQAPDGEPTLEAWLSPLDFQIWLTMAGLMSLSAWSFAAIFGSPSALPAATKYLGNIYGFAAIALAMAATSWFFKDRMRIGVADRKSLFDLLARPQVTLLIGLGALALTSFAAAACSGMNTPANWYSYHVLSVGCVVTTALMAWLAVARRSRTAELFAAFSGVVVLVLAIRGGSADPYAPWWPAGATASLAMLAVLLGARLPRPTWAWGSSILAAASITFVAIDHFIAAQGDEEKFLAALDVIWANIAALALMGVCWILIDLYRQRREVSSVKLPAGSGFTIGRVSGIVLLIGSALVLPAIVTLTALFRDPGETLIADWPALVAFASLAALLFVGLWDPKAHYALVRLYLLGVVSLFLFTDIRRLQIEQWIFELACATSIYLLLTGLLWSWRPRWAVLAYKAGVPSVAQMVERASRWLPAANFILAGKVMLISLLVVLTYKEDWMRVGAAAAVAALVPSIAMLAVQRSSDLMRYIALLIGVVATVYLGWAVLPAGYDSIFWLRRAIRLTVAMSAGAIAFGLVMVRILPQASGWFAPTRRAAATVSVGAVAALIWTLVMEGVAPAARLSAPEITQVVIVLVGLAGAFISMALLKGTDPLGLSEKGRMAYIYAAEFVLALLPLHIYLTMPQLFHGRIRPYWPLIAMAIAYAGAGLSYLARRAKLPVLAEPLERTGALLPLLPALGFWSLDSHVSYYVTLLIVTSLYGVLAMTRRKPLYTTAAVVAVNASLWAVLHNCEQSILAHPQFWLIPPALSALVAAQLNRHRLSVQQLIGVRYAAAAVIYVSAAGEIFMDMTAGGENLWPPVVLALLSVAGVMCGIFLRIRAFMYLGSSFLLLSIVSMVWHAARSINHVWPWWAFGILLGIAILTAFGLFEKKRNEIDGLLEDFRSWQP